MKQVFDSKEANGSGLLTYINDVYYHELVEALGEPTHSEPSGDNKVQKEWIFNFKNKCYTIYDWKTYDENYTMNELTRWNVGGKDYMGALEFVQDVMKAVNSKRLERV